MKIIQVENQAEGGKIAFEILKEKIEAGAKVLGLATRSSPESFYQAVINSNLDLSELTSVNLDEYVGLDASDSQSYAAFMAEHLFNYKPLKVSYLPNGKAKDVEVEMARYNKILEENPIDFQILGIGRNGHIGFNEPGTSFEEVAHLVDLDRSTIEANARFFDDISQVPTQAFSMGIKNIMSAKTIVLFAYGVEKADAIKGMVEGPITEKMPASVLQNHTDVVVIGDAAALSKLNK